MILKFSKTHVWLEDLGENNIKSGSSSLSPQGFHLRIIENNKNPKNIFII